MSRAPFRPAPGPFGARPDEMATHEAFADYVGGRERAERMSRLYSDSYPRRGPGVFDRYSKEDVFRTKALREGFSEAEIDAFLSL